MFAEIMSYAGIAAFAAGGVVSDDQLGMLHKNEMVLPSDISTHIMNSMSNSTQDNRQNQSVVANYYEAPGGRGGGQENFRDFARTVKDAVRNNRF